MDDSSQKSAEPQKLRQFEGMSLQGKTATRLTSDIYLQKSGEGAGTGTSAQGVINSLAQTPENKPPTPKHEFKAIVPPRETPAPTPTNPKPAAANPIAQPFSNIQSARTPDVAAQAVPPPHPELRPSSRTELEPTPFAATPENSPRKPIQLNQEFSKPNFNEDPQAVIRSLRTYERDIAATVRQGQTLTTIQSAEQKRKEDRKKENAEVVQTVAKNSLFTVISLVLVVATVVTLGAVFILKKESAPVPVAQLPRGIISVDSFSEIHIRTISRTNITSAISTALEKNLVSRSVNRINFVETSISGESATTPMTPETFLNTLAPQIPASLTRAFGTEWLFGVHALGTNEPFMVVTIDSFDNAYSGMLAWEDRMRTDLLGTFLPAPQTTPEIAPPSAATSTATTTIVLTIPLRTQFEDVIIKSKDTRVLRNIQGKTVLMYSFLDTKHLVITTNEDTFREVVTRFLASTLVR